jgi:hypothetical protein
MTEAESQLIVPGHREIKPARPLTPEWVTWQRLTIVLGLAGTILYGFLRFGYSQFYEPLGVSPEEVGLDRTTSLANAAVAVAIIVAIALAVGVAWLIISLLWGLFIAFWHNLYLAQQEVDGPWLIVKRAWLRTRRSIRGLAAIVLVWLLLAFAAGFVVSLYLVVSEPRHALEEMRLGQAVDLISPLGQPLNGMRIGIISLASSDSNTLEAIGRRANDCLYYLGKEGGTAILYDYQTGETMRIATDTLVTSPTNYVCRLILRVSQEAGGLRVYWGQGAAPRDWAFDVQYLDAGVWENWFVDSQAREGVFRVQGGLEPMAFRVRLQSLRDPKLRSSWMSSVLVPIAGAR